MTSAREAWNRLFSMPLPSNGAADPWLEEWEKRIADCEASILDLGCGAGTDTRWLLKRGKRVVACDWAASAVETIQRELPQVEGIRCFDMREGLPFPDKRFGLVVADLSLHYFPREETNFILGEIKRILLPRGALLFRVNSIRDVFYGIGAGEEIERHFYRMADGSWKRFFDLEDLGDVFRGWRLTNLREGVMARYGPPKHLWSGCAEPV